MAAATSNAQTGGEPLRQSRTGKRPIDLPKGVSASVKGDKFEVTGPKGTLTRPVPPNVKVSIEGSKVSIAPRMSSSSVASKEPSLCLSA